MARRGSKGDQRAARTQAERARLYEARGRWNAGQKRRRVVDNAVAAITGALLLVGIVVSQSVHAHVTQPEPLPSPTSTSTPADTDPATTPSPSETPAETPTPSPTP